MRAKARSYYLKFFGSISKPSNGVYILNSHYVTRGTHCKEKDWELFEEYLNYLSKISNLITIQEAIARIEKRDIPKDKCMVAFTFDDGFEECYTTIAPLLEKYGCTAAFFINGNYIESDESYQLEFHKRIKTFTKKPMNWYQVKELHHRGHIIGAHTLDHLNMTELTDEEIVHQLNTNKMILEDRLDYSCDCFAWTYGRMQFFSERLLKFTQNYHKLIFSGTNYKQYFSMDGMIINRRQIESFWPKSHIRYFLSVRKQYNK
jgi:hypothetical protein